MKKEGQKPASDEKIAIPFSPAVVQLIREKQALAAQLNTQINAYCELAVLEGGGDMAARWRISPSGLGMERELINPGKTTA